MPNRSFIISALLLAITGVLLIAYALYLDLNSYVIISWETATELDTAGYMIARSEDPKGPFERVTDNMIPASSEPLTGGIYEFRDNNVRAGKVYYYQLEEIETTGGVNIEGPQEVTAAYRGIPLLAIGILLLVFAWFTRRLAYRAAPIDDE